MSTSTSSRVSSPKDELIVCPFVVARDHRETKTLGGRRVVTGFSFDSFPLTEKQVKRFSGKAPKDGIRYRLLVRVEDCHLVTGDYSIVGYEKELSIERKAADLYQSVTWERENFVKELERLSAMDFAAVVTEWGWQRIANPKKYDDSWRNETKPRSVFESIEGFSFDFPKVHWWVMESRQLAEIKTFSLLYRWWWRKQKQQKQQKEQAGGKQ